MSVCWINHRIRDSSTIESPPLVVTEDHSGIFMCTNISLKSFHNQATSYEIILVAMDSVSVVLIATDFCFLLIHDIEAEHKEKQH